MKNCTGIEFGKLFGITVIVCLVIALGVDDTKEASAADAQSPPVAADKDAGRGGAAERDAVKAKAANIDILQPKFVLPVFKGKSKIIRTKEPIIRVSVGSEKIADVTPFRRNEVGVSGIAAGTTTLTLWLGDKENTKVLHMLVRVEEKKADDGK
ncbi:MAG: pilus assembly protein N-terminal domain-containing protein [Pirellulales bacterium]